MPKSGEEDFTLLIIPHSTQPVCKLRVSGKIFQACCVALALAVITLTVFAARYTQLVTQLHELRDLRALAVAQEEQVRHLTAAAEELGTRLTQLAILDAEVREMLSLGQPVAKDVMSLLHTDPAVKVAASQSGHAAALEDMLPLEIGLLAQTGLLNGTLAILSTEMDTRLSSMLELHAAAAEHLAHSSARPSIWPTQGIVTSRYGYRSSPTSGSWEFHPAIDISAPLGTPVVATGDAVVVFTGWHTNLGNTVVLDHGYDITTLYGHVAKLAVSVGDSVRRGQVIAYVGSTGRSTGPHLHYEVRLRGNEVNPAPYLH